MTRPYKSLVDVSSGRAGFPIVTGQTAAPPSSKPIWLQHDKGSRLTHYAAIPTPVDQVVSVREAAHTRDFDFEALEDVADQS
jgi:hypothetical protein